MADPEVIWPITNTLVHTRGSKTEVSVYRLGGEAAVLVLRFGGASDVSVHCLHMSEIAAINAALSKAIKAVYLGEEGG